MKSSQRLEVSAAQGSAVVSAPASLTKDEKLLEIRAAAERYRAVQARKTAESKRVARQGRGYSGYFCEHSESSGLLTLSEGDAIHNKGFVRAVYVF